MCNSYEHLLELCFIFVISIYNGELTMNKDDIFDQPEALAERDLPIVIKGKLDLVVLRYMARRVFMTLRSLDQATTTMRPLLYYLEERRRRIHRIAIYNPQELSLNNELAFVGFVSGRQKPIQPSVVAELHAVDEKLVAELVGVPGLLSYSSLELHDDKWCNLVVLNDPGVKLHLKNAGTHRYAAYELAPSHYQWIRLHNGMMPAGLAADAMFLQKTKYYMYQSSGRRPTVREITYIETEA